MRYRVVPTKIFLHETFSNENFITRKFLDLRYHSVLCLGNESYFVVWSGVNYWYYIPLVYPQVVYNWCGYIGSQDFINSIASRPLAKIK